MNTLDIFYNEIVPEASNGVIKSYFNYNITFDTYIKEDNKTYKGDDKSNGVITPLLIINNKALFNELLNEYVNISLDFYKESKYLKEIINENIDIRKNILAMLWSNATYEDFSNPIEFLQRRIDFFNTYEDNIDYGYLDILNGNLEININKDEIYNETPYEMNIKLVNDNEVFNFPLIKFGISNNKLYIYAIQNRENEKNNYTKKINRILYKANDGFNELKDTPEIYGIGNLKDISVSFLVVVNICLNYFKSLGIEDVIVSSILIERWNAKRDAITKRYHSNEDVLNDKINEQEYIQRNLTEKLLRTFLRLKVHYEDIEVLAYPFELDSNLHLNISDMNKCNNELLNECKNIIINNKNRNL